MKTADLNHQGRRLSSGARAAPSRFGGGVALVMLALLALIPAFGQDLSEGSRPRGFERAVFDLDRFAEQSDVIVRGIVSSKEPKWVGRVIYTHYDLVVQERFTVKLRAVLRSRYWVERWAIFNSRSRRHPT